MDIGILEVTAICRVLNQTVLTVGVTCVPSTLGICLLQQTVQYSKAVTKSAANCCGLFCVPFPKSWAIRAFALVNAALLLLVFLVVTALINISSNIWGHFLKEGGNTSVKYKPISLRSGYGFSAPHSSLSSEAAWGLKQIWDSFHKPTCGSAWPVLESATILWCKSGFI